MDNKENQQQATASSDPAHYIDLTSTIPTKIANPLPSDQPVLMNDKERKFLVEDIQKNMNRADWNYEYLDRYGDDISLIPMDWVYKDLDKLARQDHQGLTSAMNLWYRNVPSNYDSRPYFMTKLREFRTQSDKAIHNPNTGITWQHIQHLKRVHDAIATEPMRGNKYLVIPQYYKEGTKIDLAGFAQQRDAEEYAFAKTYRGDPQLVRRTDFALNEIRSVIKAMSLQETQGKVYRKRKTNAKKNNR